MKKRSVIVVVGAAVVALASTLLGQPAAHAAGVVPDAAFAACLNTKYLGQAATAPITAGQLQGIVANNGVPKEIGAVDCSSQGIVSVEGAQYLTGITYLLLNNNQISDPSPLNALTNLAYLDLDVNRIIDLSKVPNLLNLSLTSGLHYFSMFVQGQQVSLSSVAVGTYPVPVKSGTIPAGYGALTVSLNSTSPMQTGITINQAAGTIAYSTPGTYKVDWNYTYSSWVEFTGTFTITVTSATTGPYTYGVVQDKAFAACLNTKYLGQAATAQITAAQLQAVHGGPDPIYTYGTGVVDCRSMGIVSLEGAQYLTGALYLYLNNNQITDPSPVAGLSNLYVVNLDVNRIIDISSLSISPAPGASFTVSALGQQVTIPSVLVGAHPLPGIYGPSGAPITLALSPNPTSPAKAMTANMSAGTVTYSAPGVYKVDWSYATASSKVVFTGTYTITVTDPPGTMYRIMNPATGEHFYSSSMTEVFVNVKSGAWKFEGIGWVAPLSGAPVYRLAAIPGSGSAGHLFTTSVAERDLALASRNPAGQPYWVCETGAGMPSCVGWYSGGSVPVFRAFFPGNGQHNYTTDSNEQRVITTQQGWNDEKIGWTGVQKGNPGAPLPAV